MRATPSLSAFSPSRGTFALLLRAFALAYLVPTRAKWTLTRAFTAIALMTTAAHANCFNTPEEAVNAMDRLFGQVPKAMGTQGDTHVGETPLVLFVNPENNHWSIFVQTADGTFCPMAVGKNWRRPPVGRPS